RGGAPQQKKPIDSAEKCYGTPDARGWLSQRSVESSRSGTRRTPVMVFQILAVLVALSLPALLVIEEINSWRRSHRAPEREPAPEPVPGAVTPEPSTPRPRTALARKMA